MKLFKYRECNDYTFEAIKNQYLWLSHPSSFNDPFDCQRLYDDYGDIDNNILVHCMSESNTNLLMWGHYANGHRGICIEYEFPNRFPFCFDNVSYPFFPVCKPVRYVSSLPKIEKKYAQSLLSDEKRQRLEQYIFSKDLSWSYEKEWRLAIFLERLELIDHKVSIPDNSLKAIYLGCKISECDKEKLYQSIKHIDLELYQCVKSKKELKLEIMPLSKPRAWIWKNLNERERFLAKQIDAIAYEQNYVFDTLDDNFIANVMRKTKTTNSEREFILDRMLLNKKYNKVLNDAAQTIEDAESLLNKL